MRARRFESAVVLCVALFALVGCGTPPPTPLAPSPEPQSRPTALAPSVVRTNDGPITPPPEPLITNADPEPPRAVPVSPADEARIEEARKKGAEIYEAQNGGFEVRIEAKTDPEPVLALLKQTKCVVGLSAEGERFTDTALRSVGGFENLEQLTLHRCPKLTGTGFDTPTKWSRLKALALSECPIGDAACAPIGRIESLEEIRLLSTKVTDAGLRELAGLPALEALTLEGASVSGVAFAAPGWAKLRDIDAPGAPFDDTGMQAVAGLPALQSLRSDSGKVTDAGLVHMKRATKLTELTVSGAKITDTGLLALKELTGLRELDVSNTAIRGSAFDSFPVRPELHKLNASGTQFDDAAAAHLEKFPGLTTFKLADCHVSDVGLVALKELKKLATCDLSGTAAGDDTAKLLGALPELIDANFARTRLTDTGLTALADAPKIRQIDVSGTKVTKGTAEREKLKRARLEIRVE
jgi:internalin A